MKAKFIMFLISGIAGAGVLVATHALDPFSFFAPEVHRIEKKISVVKPKNFGLERKKFRKAALYGSENFSFFTVLNDPSMSKMVGLEGKVYRTYQTHQVKTPPEKIRPAKIITAPPIRVKKREVKKEMVPVRPSRSKQTTVKAEPVENKKVESLKKPEQDLSAFQAYAVQVSSFRKLARAEMLKGNLVKKGYASFVGKTELPDNKGTWYRVYLGRYLDRADANAAAARVQREEKLQAMVIKRQSS